MRQLPEQESLPTWLRDFKDGDGFPREQFLQSRVVFYPGSGTDGQPIKMFASRRWAHCFVYADYGISKTSLIHTLDVEHGFRQYYSSLARIPLEAQNLVPDRWETRLTPEELSRIDYGFVGVSGFGFLEILERNDLNSEVDRPERLAILFLGADAVAAFVALFCQRVSLFRAFAVVIQDHGSGGNYTSFGRDGLLEALATRCEAVPPWLWVADYSNAWNGFCSVPDTEMGAGGMHGTRRRLFGKPPDSMTMMETSVNDRHETHAVSAITPFQNSCSSEWWLQRISDSTHKQCFFERRNSVLHYAARAGINHLRPFERPRRPVNNYRAPTRCWLHAPHSVATAPVAGLSLAPGWPQSWQVRAASSSASSTRAAIQSKAVMGSTSSVPIRCAV